MLYGGQSQGYRVLARRHGHDLVFGRKEKRCLRIHEVADQPGARHPICPHVVVRNPFHRDAILSLFVSTTPRCDMTRGKRPSTVSGRWEAITLMVAHWCGGP